ncbi:LOW QUALITY PROTEIN: cyclin-dependent kinase 20-like [Limulus polyphemus]|uniref:Cyclin-dependent kinase 20 n=1 Tax=Limulus polyphemus TaxID=6850 RepID=A0ABM1BUG9_LIMPO|nr:LOW QUALITY PROTEIN: cyclin-dependent kinase 20-like [Limulus polyphemus]
MEKYTVTGHIGEGAHGIVLKARCLETGEIVALKKVPLKKLENGIPCSVLREIKALQQLDHANVVKLLDVFPYGSSVALVFEYMPTDLSVLLYDPDTPLTEAQVKAYMSMLLKGVDYCHSLGIMHRDLKPANLLISCTGWLKIADFGLACLLDNNPNKQYSHQVATRWYRAPELLYGARQYNQGVDLWAVGCIFGEMLNCFPLFRGDNDIEQLSLVLRALGTPDEQSWPGITELPDYNKISFPEYSVMPLEQLVPDVSNIARDLLSKFLVYDSDKRIEAASFKYAAKKLKSQMYNEIDLLVVRMILACLVDQMMRMILACLVDQVMRMILACLVDQVMRMILACLVDQVMRMILACLVDQVIRVKEALEHEYFYSLPLQSCPCDLPKPKVGKHGLCPNIPSPELHISVSTFG